MKSWPCPAGLHTPLHFFGSGREGAAREMPCHTLQSRQPGLDQALQGDVRTMTISALEHRSHSSPPALTAMQGRYCSRHWGCFVAAYLEEGGTLTQRLVTVTSFKKQN